MDIAAKIEKNRLAILRLIGFWLFAARLLSRKGITHLPMRVDKLVCELIFKLEKAAQLLLLVHDYHSKRTFTAKDHYTKAYKCIMDAENDSADLGIAAIIVRLEAMQKQLKALSLVTNHKQAKPKGLNLQFSIAGFLKTARKNHRVSMFQASYLPP